MCVVVALQPGARLTHSEWNRCWTANPDGAGYAFTRRHRIIIERGMSRADLWRRYYKDAQTNPKSPFLVHFRIATHGKVCLANTHPFDVDHAHKGQTVLAHNGIITNVLRDLEKEESDTRAFVRLFVRWLPAGWLDNPAIVELVEAYIDDSRIAILTTDPACRQRLYILNESQGETIDGRWFSNDYWRMGARFATCVAPVSHWTLKNLWPIVPKVKDDVSEREGTVRVDRHGVKHIPWLPNGTGALDGLSEDALTEVMVNAIDAGYCERCLWRPCWCEGVCFDCTRALDECDCGMGLSCAAYYGTEDIETGASWMDSNPRHVKTVCLTPQTRTYDPGDLAEDDWQALEDNVTGRDAHGGKGKW